MQDFEFFVKSFFGILVKKSGLLLPRPPSPSAFADGDKLPLSRPSSSLVFARLINPQDKPGG